jgi:hypothetical protein
MTARNTSIVDEHDIGTSLDKRSRFGLTYTARGARDKSHAIRKVFARHAGRPIT